MSNLPLTVSTPGKILRTVLTQQPVRSTIFRAGERELGILQGSLLNIINSRILAYADDTEMRVIRIILNEPWQVATYIDTCVKLTRP